VSSLTEPRPPAPEPTDRPGRPPSRRGAGRPAARRPAVLFRPFLLLCLLVIAAAITIRVTGLGRQSYWIDELFSVAESGATFHHLWTTGSTEIHPPLYAALLWVWMRAGGRQEEWTHLLSTLFSVASVLVAHLGLRRAPLDRSVRWALTAATAAGGASIVYSLDSRPYALLLLGTVGLTAATLRAALALVSGAEPTRGVRFAWVGWGLLAATAHLFGAFLVAAATGVLMVCVLRSSPNRLRGVLGWGARAVVAVSLQAVWIGTGVFRPLFATGTHWIQAPGADDVRDLVTTTFSSGGLQTHKDGFAWTSPLGTYAALGLLVVAAVVGWTGRRRSAPAASAQDTAFRGEGVAAAVLLALVVVTVVPLFVVSQWLHLWTLRNMLIVTPALSWAVICLAAALAGTATGRRLVATGAVLLLGLSLVPTAVGVDRPYKTDFRGMFAYLSTLHRERPDAEIVVVGWVPTWGVPGAPPPTGAAAARTPAAWHLLYRDVPLHRVHSLRKVTRTPGPEVVFLYPGTVPDQPVEEKVAYLMKRLGPGCRRLPFTGLLVIRCD
jgi:hypothetical protein